MARFTHEEVQRTNAQHLLDTGEEAKRPLYITKLARIVFLFVIVMLVIIGLLIAGFIAANSGFIQAIFPQLAKEKFVASDVVTCDADTDLEDRPQIWPGNTGSCVSFLQAELDKQGYDYVHINGTYDRHTSDVVRQFQTEHDMDIIDEVVGRKTWTILLDLNADSAK